MVPADVLRVLPVEDKRGFWRRLVLSLRGTASVARDGNFSAKVTGGATFLNGERRINPEDAWREVDRPLVVALVVLGLLAVVGLGVAVLISGCSGLAVGLQRGAVTHELEADATMDLAHQLEADATVDWTHQLEADATVADATIDFTIPVEVVSYE